MTEATGIRQRQHKLDEDGVDVTKPKDEPQGKTLKRMSFNGLMLRVALILLAISGYYLYKASVASAEVGGWWNLIRGKKPEPIPIAQQTHDAELKHTQNGGAPVEDLIIELADSLGIHPSDVTAALRPLLHPGEAAPAGLTDSDPSAHEETETGYVGAAANVASGAGSVLDMLVAD